MQNAYFSVWVCIRNYQSSKCNENIKMKGYQCICRQKAQNPEQFLKRIPNLQINKLLLTKCMRDQQMQTLKFIRNTYLSISCFILLRFLVAPSRVCLLTLTLRASMHTLSILCASSNTTTDSLCSSFEIIPATFGSSKY